MFRHLLGRPSHATVVAYLALFVALGGTSVAAVTLKRDSVKGKNIARNAVTGPKVKNGSLLATDFKAASFRRARRDRRAIRAPRRIRPAAGCRATAVRRGLER